MSEQRLNIELLRKVRDRIAAIPESYDQEHWVKSSKSAPCGTTACLGGETIICAAPTVEKGLKELRRLDESGAVAAVAASLLGLPAPAWVYSKGGYNAAGRLFDCLPANDDTDRPSVAWPEPFKSRYENAETQSERANIAVAYLDHIIETGKVE